MNRIAQSAIGVVMALVAIFPANAQSGNAHHYLASASLNGRMIYFYMAHPRSRSDRTLGITGKPAIVRYFGCGPKLCMARATVSAGNTVDIVLVPNSDFVFYAVYGPGRQEVGDIAMLRVEPGSALWEIWDDVMRGELIASAP